MFCGSFHTKWLQHLKNCWHLFDVFIVNNFSNGDFSVPCLNCFFFQLTCSTLNDSPARKTTICLLLSLSHCLVPRSKCNRLKMIFINFSIICLTACVSGFWSRFMCRIGHAIATKCFGNRTKRWKKKSKTERNANTRQSGQNPNERTSPQNLVFLKAQAPYASRINGRNKNAIKYIYMKRKLLSLDRVYSDKTKTTSSIAINTQHEWQLLFDFASV